MNTNQRKRHWNKIYKSNNSDNLSWFQLVPETSLRIIEDLNLSPDAHIMDVGGGDSYLTDHLIRSGFSNLSVLDVSEEALALLRERHSRLSEKVDYLVSDILDFEPASKVDLWHDRATLHFLTTDDEVSRYIDKVEKSVKPGGYVIIGVFSAAGPNKCSGIEIRQYDEESMRNLLAEDFQIIRSFRIDHLTPSQKTQNFIFTVFRKQA